VVTEQATCWESKNLHFVTQCSMIAVKTEVSSETLYRRVFIKETEYDLCEVRTDSEMRTVPCFQLNCTRRTSGHSGTIQSSIFFVFLILPSSTKYHYHQRALFLLHLLLLLFLLLLLVFLLVLVLLVLLVLVLVVLSSSIQSSGITIKLSSQLPISLSTVQI
jgi:hypothetical protein